MTVLHHMYVVLANPKYTWGWPKPYKYTVYDRIFGGFPAIMTVLHHMYVVPANPKYTWGWPEPYICTVYDRTSDEIP